LEEVVASDFHVSALEVAATTGIREAAVFALIVAVRHFQEEGDADVSQLLDDVLPPKQGDLRGSFHTLFLPFSHLSIFY
ncbi:MAG: hypothetical protein J5767_14815, partial [Paludibacteraceae bacterium]|nr:hypothetical protein [Paludibacteraceae bacterium]